MNQASNPPTRPRMPIRQFCPACGGVRRLSALIDAPICRSEAACMQALLAEADAAKQTNPASPCGPAD